VARHRPANQGGGGNQDRPPTRDLVLKDGQQIKLGDEMVTAIEVPGHTPGSLAFIFEVRENGQKHMAGLFGGAILAQGRIPTDGLNQYLRSINHYLETARKMKVDVEIQNHALFDDTPGRVAKLKAESRESRIRS
jgi:metallo-beta-lactamase class B